MAFKIAPKNEIKTKVVVEQLSDMGKTIKTDFVAVVKKLPASSVRELTEQLKNGELTENEVIKTNIIDWQGVLDADDNEVMFSSDMLDQLLDIVEVRKALSLAFWQVQSGETARKN